MTPSTPAPRRLATALALVAAVVIPSCGGESTDNGSDPDVGTRPDTAHDTQEVPDGLEDLEDGGDSPSVFSEVSAGEQHSCALAVDQTVECWGRDTDGQASPP